LLLSDLGGFDCVCFRVRARLISPRCRRVNIARCPPAPQTTIRIEPSAWSAWRTTRKERYQSYTSFECVCMRVSDVDFLDAGPPGITNAAVFSLVPHRVRGRMAAAQQEVPDVSTRSLLRVVFTWFLCSHF
jgi:hypothetical protein